MRETIYTCEKCKSATHTEAFRKDAKNFYTQNASLTTVGGGGPGMPGASTSDPLTYSKTLDICKDCADAENAVNKQINTLMDSLKV